MLIKSLPKEERPLEKAIRSGVQSLSNAELLGIIIHTGTRNRSAIHLAESVLAHCRDGITDLSQMGFDELMELEGIGASKAGALLAAVELGKRIASTGPLERVGFETAGDVADMFMEPLRHEKKEHFKSVLINNKGEVLQVDDVSTGELSRTLVHPREAFQKAVRKSASGVIFVHNHPSGDPTPSEDDIETTKRLMESGEILGIQVLDHIIIGDGCYSSFREMNLMQ